mgnify:FL=1
MICKYYLMIGSDTVDTADNSCIDVSRMIANISDIKTTYTRVDLGGVVRKCGSTMEFVEEARERFISLYNKDKLKSLASFAVYGISNNWTYNKLFECPHDFSTFKYDSYRARIGCIDNSAAALIKANKGTIYEYPVSEMREDIPLNYDGVRIRNEVSFQIIGETVEDKEYMEKFIPKDAWWWIPYVNYTVTNEVNNRSFVAVDQEETFLKSGTDCGWGFPANSCTSSFFLECIEDNYVTVDFSNFYIESKKFGHVLCKITTSGNIQLLTCGYSNLLGLDANTNTSAIKWSGKLLAGERLQYAIFNHQRMSVQDGRTVRIHNNTGITSWNDLGDPVNIDVISPLKLLSRLLESISANSERIYCSIKPTIRTYISNAFTEKDNWRLNGSRLVAAESIRNFEKAKIYSSFSKFCEWMETVFGYVYTIEMKSRPNTDLPYADILNNSHDFEGFTTYKANITSITDNFTLHFSTTDGYFLAIVYASITLDRSPNFPGYERYQVYDNANKSYKVHEDRYYHDTVDDMYYHAVYDDGSKKTSLLECQLYDIGLSDYKGVQTFGGTIISVETDSGSFTGPVDESNILYVRRSKQFMYSDNDKYYSSFTGSSNYNIADRARTDMVFFTNEQYYVIVGTSLMKCTLKENVNEGEKVPYVVFKHRDEVFGSTNLKTIHSISEPEYSVDSSRIYSEIEIGYEKQDYDLGNNGNDEFNFSTTYTTGVTLNNSKLSLISPYRADCYGFEELIGKRGEETSSSDSDKQVFAVKCINNGGKYIVDRTIMVEGAYTNSVFNAPLAPVYMIEANKRYLASFTSLLKFASTEGNAGIKLDGRAVNTDISLDDPLFGPGNIKFSTDSFIFPEDWNNTIVQIEWNGMIFKGNLMSLDVKPQEIEALKYELIEIV